MNIADPNLLEIIAKHIDNKPTFNNFARSSKKCSQIVKKLAEIKKFEFKHIDFDLVSSKSACIWNGCYTKGIVKSNQTRVWFYLRGLEPIYDCDFDIKNYNENFEIYDFHIGNEDLLGDFCQLRQPCITHIIDALNNKLVCSCSFTSKKYLKLGYFRIDSKLDNFLNQINDEKLMIHHDYGDIYTIWRVKNIEAVIEELEKVRNFCYKNEILYEW